MSLWEYKVITSGKGGFATPALLEKFLNDLGRDEWEIVEFRSSVDNVLAFSGLARRSTQRDWTLQDAAATAAKAEADKLRVEFEAKFKAATSTAAVGGEERTPSLIEEKVAPEDDFRKPVDTSRDDDPDAEEKDDWDKLTAAEEDELPSFFEAIKPHMRRNQRGPGMSVGVDYLAKKWDQSEEDLKGALVECGFEVPEDEDAKPVVVEYEGDLYWVNVNRRGELWINTKEKPRPMFKAVKAQRVTVEDEAAAPASSSEGQRTEDGGPQKTEDGGQRSEDGGQRTEDRGRREDRGGRRDRGDRGGRGERGGRAEGDAPRTEGAPAADATPGEPLPTGPELLEKIRPLMRRNRRGPGGSGSTSFLSRALKVREDDLKAAFVTFGLVLPTSANDKPVYVEVGSDVWWLNTDSRGGVWINGREKKDGDNQAEAGDRSPESPAEPLVRPESVAFADQAPAAETSTSTSTSSSGGVLAGVRLLLKETKTGAIAAKVDNLAEELGKSAEEILASLTGAGLKVPEKSREKPVFVEHAGEIFWLNRNTKDELWLNAKASKFADKVEDSEGEAGAAPDAGGGSTEGGDEKKPASRLGRGRRSTKPKAGPGLE